MSIILDTPLFPILQVGDIGDATLRAEFAPFENIHRGLVYYHREDRYLQSSRMEFQCFGPPVMMDFGRWGELWVGSQNVQAVRLTVFNAEDETVPLAKLLFTVGNMGAAQSLWSIGGMRDSGDGGTMCPVIVPAEKLPRRMDL